MPNFKLVVLSNPVEGREDEYNRWYTHTHVPDLLRVPGILSAQRFRLSEAQRAAGMDAWKYLAIYECQADSVSQVMDCVKGRAGTRDMEMSDALAESRISCYFEPITKVMRSAVW